MLSNFFASSGNCKRMSPPINMLSKYIHFLCMSNQTCERRIFFPISILWISLRVKENLASLTHLNSLRNNRQIFFPLLYGTKEGSNKAAASHAL